MQTSYTIRSSGLIAHLADSAGDKGELDAVDTGMNRSKIDQDAQAVYERLGLTSALDRSQFNAFNPPKPKIQMDVVISTTSDPFPH